MTQGGLGFTHESTYNESIEWYTPPEIFDALGVAFDLDPCSPLAGPLPWIPATNALTIADDGLATPWEGRVWMNPPYGKQTQWWMKKLAQHGNGIALVFSRTDTEWFHHAAQLATAVCFVKQRIRFVKPDRTRGGTPGSGSMLLAFGDDNAEALRASGLGTCMALVRSLRKCDS